MLTHHCDALGHKKIVAIRVLRCRETSTIPTFYVILDNAVREQPAQPAPAKAEKAPKRSVAGQRRRNNKRQKMNPKDEAFISLGQRLAK